MRRSIRNTRLSSWSTARIVQHSSTAMRLLTSRSVKSASSSLRATRAGIIELGELSSYKFIKSHDIRVDLVLLAMVSEVAQVYRVQSDRFFLHGFSGGGHFPHRFFYLHPQRLAAVSIGAPGTATLLNAQKPWWVSVGDLKEQFDIDLDIDAMRNVAVQIIVGGADTETWEITVPEGARWWMPGVNDSGQTRIDRLNALRESFEQHGITARHEIVPCIAHAGFELLPHVGAFFSDTLATMREGAGND